MKSKIKRFLSLLLTVCLVFLAYPAPVFAAGEPPVLVSAVVVDNGAAVELTFDKDMAAPESGSAGFAVKFSVTDKQVAAAQLDGTDSTKIRLTLTTAVKGGEDVWMSYTPGTVAAADGGVLGAIPYEAISNTLPRPVLSSSLPPGGMRNIPYSHTFAISGGQDPYTFSSGGELPPGLTLNASTGVLSGTPSATGIFNFGITVVDSNSAIDSRAFSIPVDEAVNVCQIGSTGYLTLDAVLNTVPTGGAMNTIKILQDINYDGCITVNNQKITFDLNGKTLSVNNTSGTGLSVTGSEIDITNPGAFNVTGSTKGLSASDSTVKVTNVNSNTSYGIIASNSDITVTNDVTATLYMAATASAGSKISIGGNVSGDDYGVYAQDTGTAITVTGNVSATAGNGIGAHSRGGAAVTIHGDINAPGSNGLGANMGAGGTLTVDGTITAGRYLMLGGAIKTEADKTTVTTKPGYNTYTDGSSTVWVAMTDAEIVPVDTLPTLTAGYQHALAIMKNDGTLRTWGWNASGQLGTQQTGNIYSIASPVTVPNLSGMISVAGGYAHSLALKSDGTVWAWGANNEGQLGNNSTTDSYTPVQVSGLTGVTAIAAGRDHSLALKSDGTVWAWGYGYYGQLGDGGSGAGHNSLTPVQVQGLSGVTAVSASNDGDHCLALKSDGTVWRWGLGQLEDGAAINRSIPVQITGLNGITAIVAGYVHSLAVDSSGAVWAWGFNGDGRFGNGTTDNSFIPVKITGISGVSSVSAGNTHSLFLKTDGTVLAVGLNDDGQLGDETTASSSTPVRVSGLTNVVEVSAGGTCSFALKNDGTVWGWGSNMAKQLGIDDPAVMNSKTPVSVTLPGDVLWPSCANPAPTGVCQIGGTQYASLDAALGTVSPGQTAAIKLLGNIIHNKGIKLSGGENITFDLNGHSLHVDGRTPGNSSDIGEGILVEKGSIAYTSPGSFSVIGDKQGVRAAGASSYVTVGSAEASAENGTGAVAMNGGSVVINGPATGGAFGVSAGGREGLKGSTVVVNGDTTGTTATDGSGASAGEYGSVTINGGNSRGVMYGVYANGDDAIVKVNNGDATGTGTYSHGVHAEGGGSIDVSGNVQGSQYGVVVSGTSSSAVIGGNVTVTASLNGWGIDVESNGVVEIGGNVMANGQSLGVFANSGGKATIDGTIQAQPSRYIQIYNTVTQAPVYFDGSPESRTNPTTMDGYYTYSAGPSTVWVKIPSVSVWPSGSALTANGTTDTSTVLSWTAATGARDYSIYRGNSYVGTSGGTRTYTVTGLSPDTEYTFQVQAAYLDETSGTAKWTTDGPSVKVRTSLVPSASTYTVTVINGTGSGSYEQGAAVSVTANAATSGQTFDKWTSSDGVTFANANSANTTFTMPGKAVTVTATYKNTGGDSPSGGSGGGGTTAPKYEASVTGGDSSVKIEVKADANNASAELTSAQAASGKNVTVAMPKVSGVMNYSLGIPVPSLSKNDSRGSVTLNTNAGNITLPSDMLTGMDAASGSKAQIKIGAVKTSDLPKDAQDKVGNRPIVSISLSIDGKTTEWNNPKAPVTVSIPYTPTAGELKNPEGITIWYIDGKGKLTEVRDAKYDPVTKGVVFTTIHFSFYAVGYKAPASSAPTFTDVLPGSWYYDAVSFIAARGITTGTGGGNFSPDTKLTRGQFLVMVMKAYDMAPDASSEDNFSDAGDTYYTGYLAAAKRLGITEGVGSNLFAPAREITRQEMFTLLYNTLKAIGKLPQGDSSKKLSDFIDVGQIDSWAKDAMTLLVETGTIGGNAGKLTPTSTTTRAEIAQVLYNLLKK